MRILIFSEDTRSSENICIFGVAFGDTCFGLIISREW
jgi:hypothetical protein